MGDPVDGLPVVWVALEQAAQGGRVQRQRDADQGRPACERPLELHGESPAAGGGGLEQRVGVCRTERARVGRRQERCGPAVQDRLGRGHRHDDVGLDQSGVDLQRSAVRVAEVDEVRALGVVHLDSTVEAAGELRRDEQLELAVSGLAAEAGGDEERLLLEGRAGAVELRHRRGDRGPARISKRPGDWKSRRLDDDRRASSARDERLEWLAGQREAERVPDGGRHVGDRLAGWRGHEHDVVVRRLHDGEPRPVGQGQAWH
jgi:hypothetical protein